MATASICPFTPATRPLDHPDPDRAVLRATGHLVRLDAPAGGPVWLVTDPELARTVLGDIRFAKDPALAPDWWDRRTAGLEPTAAEQMSLTTLDGPPHAALRATFAPLFSARAMNDAYDGMLAVARRLLASLATGECDLVADFSTRYPLAVLCDLLGVPADQVDEAVEACHLMHVDYPAHVGEAMGGFAALAGAGIDGDRDLARRLEGRMPAGSTRGDLEYQIFTLLYAGQLTTDLALGFLVARLLDGRHPGDHADLVRSTLSRHPSAPFSLWRFTTVALDLAGVPLPARTPVLVDIQGVNDQGGGRDLTFGAGPHYCIGAHLAQLELQALAEVITTDYPAARLLVPFDDLRHAGPGGIMGSRLLTLPVALT